MNSAVKVSYAVSSDDDSNDCSPRSDSEHSATDIDSGDEQENDKIVTKVSHADRGSDNGEEDHSSSRGLASVMANILGKTLPAKKNAILAKAKTDKQLSLTKKIKEAVDIVKTEATDEVKVKTEDSAPESTQESYMQQRMRKRMWEQMGRVRPNVLGKEKERNLQRIATRGVVQLFNAVKKQQKTVEDKLKSVGSSVRKQEQVLGSLTKGEFIDVLKRTATNQSTEPLQKKKKTGKQAATVKEEPLDSDGGDVMSEEDGGRPSWDILREDYMMGAKMKDWDKHSDSDSGDGDGEAEGSESEGDSDS